MVPEFVVSEIYQMCSAGGVCVTFSFLTRACATEVFPEADGPAMPMTWRVNHGGLYSAFSLPIPLNCVVLLILI
jgi:hypothetical protein